MRTYVFIWYTNDGHRREYKTKALNMIEAQARYGSFQARKRTNKHYISMWQIESGKRQKIDSVNKRT